MALDQKGAARKPGSAPTPPARRVAPHGSGFSLLVAVSLGIVAWMFITTVMSRSAPAAAVDIAPPPNECADAVERVQAYRAPGQRESLADAVAASVAAEGLRRPVAVVAWGPPYAWSGGCEVSLQLSIGNQFTTLRWAMRTDTGRVEAMNDIAQRMSGW